jgi:hypothetical protein
MAGEARTCGVMKGAGAVYESVASNESIHASS